MSEWLPPELDEHPASSPDEPQSDRTPPEQVAAIINMLVVLLIPLAMVVAFFVHRATDLNAPVRPPGNYFVSDLAGSLIVFVPFAPLALIAGWRTWTYARAYLAGTGTGWRGVIEAGTLGLSIALAILVRPALMHPLQAPPYLTAYGGIAAVLGLAVGLVLRFTALLTLRIVARFHR